MNSFGKILTVFFIFSASLFPVYGQEIEVSGNVGAQGIIFEETNPFWLRSNNFGARLIETNGLGYAFAKAETPLSKSISIEAGAGLFYRDGAQDRLQRDQLYLQLSHKWAQLTIGSKRSDIALNGLSTSNQNILWSGNARSIPGVALEAPGRLVLFPRFSVDYGIGHYALNDNRFVENTYIHYKRLGLFYKSTSRSTFGFTLQHFAQWGGTSPELGELPSGFGDFINVFLAQKAGDEAPDGEVVNALGNHLGSYNFSYEYKSDSFGLEIYHQHLFEDGSGSAFKNFPDGIWGITYAPSQGFIKRLLYEYVDTSNQSGTTGRSARDNYFSNKIYRSGWTYEGATIGIPFIFRNEPVGGFTNNRAQVHHLGAFAQHGLFDFTAKVSIVKNLGTYAVPFSPTESTIYTYGQGDYNSTYGTFSIMGGLDSSNTNDTNYGLAFGYQYTF